MTFLQCPKKRGGGVVLTREGKRKRAREKEKEKNESVEDWKKNQQLIMAKRLNSVAATSKGQLYRSYCWAIVSITDEIW